MQILACDERKISNKHVRSRTMKSVDGSTVNDGRDGECWTYVRKTANVERMAIIRVHAGRLTEISAYN